MIEIRTLQPGITLRCFRDTRFKQGCLSIQFVRTMEREESPLNAILPAVLLRGTRRHSDLRAITEHLDTLYGAAVSPLVRRVGDYQTVGLYCAFMDDRFALPGDRVMAPMLEFLEELLLEPLTEGEGFQPEILEVEKKNLIAAIESDLNDKRAYAMSRLLKNMCSADSFGLPRLGEARQVAAICPGELYRHYQKILRESPVQIFYVGSADSIQVAELLQPLVEKLGQRGNDLPPQTARRESPESHTEEAMDVTQGKLCLGFTTSVTNRSRSFAAMQLLNTVFGSGMTSKLFMNVREKLSLCYSVGSGYYGSKGIMTVAAGIDFDKVQQTREEIFRQLDACRRGDISPAELNAAKAAIASSLRATHDSPGAIEGYYATAALSGMGMTPAEYMTAVDAVTLEDVTAAANTLKLHSSFFLKGVQA